MQNGPWAVTGVLRDSSPTPHILAALELAGAPGPSSRFMGANSSPGQYGLNADHPLTRPRAFQNTLLTPARCRAGQVSLSAHPPGVGNFLSLYHPITTTARPTPYHPSPQAGVPLGGETPTKEKWTRSGQKKKPHRRRTKKQRTEFVKEVHFLLGRNRGEICRTSAGQERQQKG